MRTADRQFANWAIRFGWLAWLVIVRPQSLIICTFPFFRSWVSFVPEFLTEIIRMLLVDVIFQSVRICGRQWFVTNWAVDAFESRSIELTLAPLFLYLLVNLGTIFSFFCLAFVLTFIPFLLGEVLRMTVLNVAFQVKPTDRFLTNWAVGHGHFQAAVRNQFALLETFVPEFLTEIIWMNSLQVVFQRTWSISWPWLITDWTVDSSSWGEFISKRVKEDHLTNQSLLFLALFLACVPSFLGEVFRVVFLNVAL